MALDSDHLGQYLKYSVFEKVDEILCKIYMKHPQKKYFYKKTLPVAIIISRRESPLVYCLRSYKKKIDLLLSNSLFLKILPQNLFYFVIVKF